MANMNRGERLQIMLTREELKALDDWRFAKRMPSRASAIRELLRHGLATLGTLSASAGAKSKDYGVVGSGSKSAARRPGAHASARQNGNGASE